MKSEEDAATIRKAMADAQNNYSKQVVTAVEPLKNFYPAEEYHKEYFKKNPNAGYCRAVIAPKVKKIKHAYGAILVKH